MKNKKRFLKKFSSIEEYEEYKYNLLGIPHVVSFRNDNSVIFKASTTDEETVEVVVENNNKLLLKTTT